MLENLHKQHCLWECINSSENCVCHGLKWFESNQALEESTRVRTCLSVSLWLLPNILLSLHIFSANYACSFSVTLICQTLSPSMSFLFATSLCKVPLVLFPLCLVFDTFLDCRYLLPPSPS